RRHLSVAARYLDPRAAPVVLPVLQDANSVASKYSARELVGFAWPLRKMRQQDRFPLSRRRIAYRAFVPRGLGIFSLENRDRLLGLRFHFAHRDLCRS